MSLKEVENWIDKDQYEPPYKVFNDSQLIEIAKGGIEESDSEEELLNSNNNKDSDEESPNFPPPSLDEVLPSTLQIRRWSRGNKIVTVEENRSVDSLMEKMVQLKIDIFYIIVTVLEIAKEINQILTVITEEVELNILLYFTETPRNSTTNTARYFNISRTSIVKVLKKHHYKPYRIVPVQKLFARDREFRLQFCQEMVNRHNENNLFINNILFTDESTFSTSGERKNNHHWASENPRVCHEIKKQGCSTVNVWCGIHKNKILGPIFIERSLTGEEYLNMLRTSIEELLDDMPFCSEIDHDLYDIRPGEFCHDEIECDVSGIKVYASTRARTKFSDTDRLPGGGVSVSRIPGGRGPASSAGAGATATRNRFRIYLVL
ncbi:hypothetical protein NQ318_009019 [Aromia moschata]|uniref:Transposase n=1 Tax=Aromia moschata TaxID=1265417 RepID=A0AAV8YUG6_9CUCU|nr:hypothetical protein NQ318_009019 [Aromia moschata]